MNRFKSLWKSLTSATAAPGFAETEHNFTPRAGQVLALARKEAERFHHNFVGTEHLLLGLISLGQGVAVNVLWKMGINLETARLEVEKQVGTGPDQKMLGNVPYTPRGKKVLLLAAKEAQALNHTYVGTEHLLLGLLREGDGVAARVLKDLEVDIEKTRQEILRELDPNFPGTLKGVEPLTSDLPPVPARTATLPNAESAKPQPELIDISKRYDVYCAEREQEVVVYRNALFKGVRALFPENRNDLFSQFVQIEQADSQTVFIAKYSIIKFCKPGATPD